MIRDFKINTTREGNKVFYTRLDGKKKEYSQRIELLGKEIFKVSCTCEHGFWENCRNKPRGTYCWHVKKIIKLIEILKYIH